MRDFNLSPRDVALYQRSNDYLTRMNALDPYSREYANVYNDYVDTIDQLSNRDFRASLGSTLLEFAPMTRPRVQPRAPEPKVTPYGITVSSPDWKALPYTTAESQPRTANQQIGLSSMVADSVEPTAQGLALMQQAAPSPAIESQTQEVVPYGITVSSPDWRAYPYTTAEPQPSVVPYGVYGAMGPVLQTAKENVQRSSSKGQAKSQSSSTTSKRTPVPYGRYGAMTPVLETARMNAQGQVEPEGTDFPQAIDLPPMMIESIKPLVQYINNTTNSSIKRGQNTPVNIPSYFGPSPFIYSPPYARALSELSEWGQDTPTVFDWY